MRDGGSEVAHTRSDSDGAQQSAQVLRFRPRAHSGERPFPRPAGEPSEHDNEPPDDLAEYEQDREEDENINYRQRMLMNVMAALVLTLLVGAGVWIADTIADMQRDQDCVFQGRQNCAPIEVPLSPTEVRPLRK
jgi:hypothetical protein